jgi:hypothetical protein
MRETDLSRNRLKGLAPGKQKTDASLPLAVEPVAWRKTKHSHKQAMQSARRHTA